MTFEQVDRHGTGSVGHRCGEQDQPEAREEPPVTLLERAKTPDFLADCSHVSTMPAESDAAAMR